MSPRGRLTRPGEVIGSMEQLDRAFKRHPIIYFRFGHQPVAFMMSMQYCVLRRFVLDGLLRHPIYAEKNDAR